MSNAVHEHEQEYETLLAVAGRPVGGGSRPGTIARRQTQRCERLTGRVLTDGELLQAINAANPTAWSQLVERHSPRLRAIVRAQGLDAGSADDVVQATWVALLDNAAKIRNPEAVRGWLATVARNEAIRVGKQLAKAKPTEITDSVLGPDQLAASPEGEALLRTGTTDLASALKRLPSAWAELVRLRYGSSLTYEEIHEITGVPMGSIGPTVGRALTALRQMTDRLERSNGRAA